MGNDINHSATSYSFLIYIRSHPEGGILLLLGASMRFILCVLTQRDAIVVGAGLRQPRRQVFIKVTVLEQIVRNFLLAEMITETAQTDNILYADLFNLFKYLSINCLSNSLL